MFDIVDGISVILVDVPKVDIFSFICKVGMAVGSTRSKEQKLLIF